MERSAVDLSLQGKTCRVHRDDRVARSFEEGAHLIELRPIADCNWDDEDAPPTSAPVSAPLLVDRHDARTLLDEMALQSLCDGASSETRASAGASQPLEEDGTKEEIDARNFERFGMLPEYSACFVGSKLKRKSRWGEKPDATNKSKGDADGACGDKGTIPESSKEEAFQLSEEKMRGLPEGISLPKTARQNTIIEHTASRIASNPQLEVFVKVKQGANSDFSFLQPSDELHAYYLHLKGKNVLLDEGCSKKSDSDNASDNPLSGLLGGYASSSDESSSPVKNDIATIGKSEGKSTDNNIQTDGIEQCADAGSQPSDLDKKRKAERMERLRTWKESRLKQS